MTQQITSRVWSRSGSVMLEFVIAFPIVLVLMLACIQITHLWIAKQVVHYAAFCGARAALVAVCEPAANNSPNINNDSWPMESELAEAGSGFRVSPRSEAELWACKAAAQVCAWIVMGEDNGELGVSIPGWGRIPGSGAAERKTQATVVTEDWNVGVTVQHDFALIVPIIGSIMAYGMNPWEDADPWGRDQEQVNAEFQIGGQHRVKDTVPYPFVRMNETVWLPKPYRTVIAAGNPKTGGSWHGYP